MKKKNYVYPKLAKYDYGYFTVNGSGLANLLYMYSRALVYAKNNNLEIIWPTWFSVQLNRIIKFKKDKRWYNDLFTNRSGYIHGIKKIAYLLTKKKILITETIPSNLHEYEDTIFCFWGFYGKPLENILNENHIVLNDIKTNLHRKNQCAFDHDYNNKIGIHIRLDDFRTNNSINENKISSDLNNRIPIQWYIDVISKIRKIIGSKVLIEVYSDGKDSELHNILALENVVRNTFNTAIADILALSQYKLLIGSGSTFSVFARYLGKMDSISPKNQIREHVLSTNDSALEIELDFDEEIPDNFKKRIIKIYGTINK